MGMEMDYTAFIADLEAKRAALDAMLTSLRAALALGALGLPSGEIPMAASGLLSSPYSSASGGEVPAGAFHGKSIPEAAKLYLEIVKKKQTTREIAEALRKGGMESSSRNFPQMVHSVLDRARKANTGIIKLDRSHWGLAEWYPASLRASVGQEKRGNRKKVRKAKGRKGAPETTQSGPLALTQGKPTDRVVEFLRRNHTGEYSPADIGKALGMGEKGIRLMMGRLLKAGTVAMSAPGMYRIEMAKATA